MYQIYITTNRMALNRLLLNREVNNDYIELHINCELFGHSTLHNEQIMMAVYYTVYRLCNAHIFMHIRCTATATKYLCFTLTGPMNPTFLLYMNNFDSKKVHFRYIESVLVMDFGCTNFENKKNIPLFCCCCCSLLS